MLRWTLASQALQQYDWLQIRHDDHKFAYIRSTNALKVFDGRSSILSSPKDTLLFMLGCTALSAVYNSPHLLGWNCMFPSQIYVLVWRCSVSYIVSFGLFWSTMVLLARLWPNRFTLATMVVTRVLHAVASYCILVASFIQLCYLDPTAYLLPSWSNYFPHFS